MSKTPTQGASFDAFGKSHGSPVVNSNDDVFWLAWNSTGPFLYAWRSADGSLESAAVPFDGGSDIISDCFDPLLLSPDGLLFVTLSTYSTGDTPVTLALYDGSKPLSGAGQPVWSLALDGQAMMSAAAFVTLSTGQVLLTLAASKHELQVRDLATGKVASSYYLSGSCDWRAAMVVVPGQASAVDTGAAGLGRAGQGQGQGSSTANATSSVIAGTNPRAFVLCPDDTFSKPTLRSFDLETKDSLFSITAPALLKGYWPHPIAYWAAADLLVGLTAKNVWYINPANGSVVWRVYTESNGYDTFLAYALGAASTAGSISSNADTGAEAGVAAAGAALRGSGAAAGVRGSAGADVAPASGTTGTTATAVAATTVPLLYLLGSSSTTRYVYLAALNTTGDLVAPVAILPIRVDQFQGTLLLWPDGLTVTINGWDPSSPKGGSPLSLVTMRLDLAAGKFNTLWYGPSWDSSDGRTTMFAAPRTNGSVVVAGWNGVYQYN